MKYIRITFLLLIVLLSLASCSQTGKVLKSKDTEKIYQAALEAYRAKEYKTAITFFEAIYNDMFSSNRADTILFYNSKSYYYDGAYDIAIDGFDGYRKNFSRRPFSEEAEYLLPMAYYHLSRPAERDQTETHMAITTFNEYLNRYPESIKADDIKIIIEELQNKLYEKAFINAALYFKIRQYPASIAALRHSLKDMPETPYRETMMYLICKSWYNYAKNSTPARKLDRYMKMVDSYYNFKTEFPDNVNYIKELDKMYLEAQTYVDYNQQTTIDIEKNRIDAESLKESIKLQKEKLRTISDQLERNQAKLKLKADQATLKQQHATIKSEAKTLKKNDAKVKKSDMKANKDGVAGIKEPLPKMPRKYSKTL